MEVKLAHHDLSDGWNVTPLPELDSPSTLVVVFGAPEYLAEPAALAELAAAYPNSTLLGCSTAGEIFGTKVNDRSLAVAVVRFDATRIRRIAVPIAAVSESCATGEAIADALADKDLRGVFILSDGLNVNGTELVRGIARKLPASVVVTGGLAGDGARFERTWILEDGAPQSGLVSAVGLYGEKVQIGHGSKGGWDSFGPRRQVTRSEGNVLFELDGRPALDLYKEYLGDRASGLPATGLLFPLALLSDDITADRQIVRTILAVDEGANSLTFAGDIPNGSRVQLMKANFDRLIEGAEEAGEGATTTLGAAAEGDVLALAISCVGRRLVLSERTEEEVEATLDVLPPGTQQIGFYSYGEISPLAAGPCELHNQTMTLTTLREI